MCLFKSVLSQMLRQGLSQVDFSARFERILEVTQPTETGDCRSYNRDHKMSFTVMLRVGNIVPIKVMLQFVV